ncbi:MAG TPA: gamma-glutamyltransferase, partial [Opitutaceae bacterium]
AHSREVVALDFRESAPAAATPELLRRGDGPLPFAEAVASGRSVGVPGTVRGWHEALARYGTMDFDRVLAPAIRTAEQGFRLDENFFRLTRDNVGKFARFPGTAALYLRDGEPLPVGTHLRNPDLARAYRLIARDGVDGFYAGELGAAIVRAVNQPPVAPGMTALAGAMRLGDLRDYEVRFRTPLRSMYRGYDIVGMPPPSSGGIAVAEALNILEAFPLETLAPAQCDHLFIEASRLAFADRNAYVGDSEFTDVPVAGLLSKAFARERAATIDPRRTRGVAAAGDPFAHQKDASVPLRPRRAAGGAAEEPAHTTHFAVSDAAGNIVACTFTIESWGGSGIVVPGYGFLLNNELTDFDFSGPSPNVPEARKRPRSSMSPTLVFRDGRPVLTIGSPGGATIITTVLQILMDRLGRGTTLAEAIARPRLSQRNGETTRVERLFTYSQSDDARALEALGHRWDEVDEIGAANGLEFHADGSVTAVSEPCRHGVGSAIVQTGSRAHPASGAFNAPAGFTPVYPQSEFIAGLAFDDRSARIEAPGSDIWPVTWAADGHLYTAWGDGGGFGGSNAAGRVLLGVAAIRGGREDYRGFNIAGGVDALHPAPFGGKSEGILALGDTLYLWRDGDASSLGYFKFIELWRSDDCGATWRSTGVRFSRLAGDFPEEDAGIFAPAFCQFGQAYAGARDEFVYIYAPDSIDVTHWRVRLPGRINLLRVPRERIEDRDAYEFFAGIGTDGVPRWTRDTGARAPVWKDAKHGTHRVAVSYNPGLKRYLLTTIAIDRSGWMSVYEAAEPWGPWAHVQTEHNPERWGRLTIIFTFVNKWLSADGRDFVLVHTRNDHWASIPGRFVLTGERAPAASAFDPHGR